MVSVEAAGKYTAGNGPVSALVPGQNIAIADLNWYLAEIDRIMPGELAMVGGHVPLLVMHVASVQVVAVPVLGVKVRVSLLVSRPVPAAWMTVAICPSVTVQELGDVAQSEPCTIA
jgi:hypothetical protein